MADRPPVALLVGGAALLILVVLLVAMSVRRPEPVMFRPTPVRDGPPRERLVGPELVTVDARAGDRWRHFSFARGSVVEDPGPMGWDIAFRRFQVRVNGGADFAGNGGAVDLGEVAFDSVRSLPLTGYVGSTSRGDSINPALEDWFAYSFTSHLLTPEPRVYAVRTADGRYAKLRFEGYYCTGATPGCVAFRYVFQGAGGVDLTAAPAQSE